MTTPAADGFRMPAEWAPHARCWMAWPCRADTWIDGRIGPARAAYAAVARAIARFEPVTMVCNPADAAAAAEACGPGVAVLPLPLSDSWMRDIGPSFVADGDGRVAGVDWGFNAWGGNYADCAADADIARRILDHLGLRRYAAPLVLEGGSIHVDGAGTVLTTEECLLNPNRNPALGRDEIERLVHAHLGTSRMIWLGRGYEQDETDGHIDEIACFARPGLVLMTMTDDPADANHPVFRDNLDRLRAARDARGQALEVVALPQPARRDEGGGRLTLSYTNFYVANGGIVMPAFDDPADGPAREILARAFPDRTVVQVPALDIVRGGGGIHCITQQQPLGR